MDLGSDRIERSSVRMDQGSKRSDLQLDRHTQVIGNFIPGVVAVPPDLLPSFLLFKSPYLYKSKPKEQPPILIQAKPDSRGLVVI